MNGICSPVNAYQEAVKKLRGIDPGEAARRTGARFDPDGGRLEIVYFGSLYLVDTEGNVSRAGNPGEEVPYNDRTLIIQYLCDSTGLQPRGSWISFLQLPDGAHHYAPFQNEAAGPLARVFGRRPEKFAEAARALGGTPLSIGDCSFLVPALPRLPLAVAIWEEDDEFPASGNILFDSVSPMHLTTAALWVLGIELANKMISHFDPDTGRGRKITWLEGVRND